MHACLLPDAVEVCRVVPVCTARRRDAGDPKALWKGQASCWRSSGKTDTRDFYVRNDSQGIAGEYTTREGYDFWSKLTLDPIILALALGFRSPPLLYVFTGYPLGVVTHIKIAGVVLST